MKQLGLIRLAEYGPVLSTRDLGREASNRIQEAVGKSGLVIGFEGVEIATPSFLDEELQNPQVDACRFSHQYHHAEKLS